MMKKKRARQRKDTLLLADDEVTGYAAELESIILKIENLAENQDALGISSTQWRIFEEIPL